MAKQAESGKTTMTKILSRYLPSACIKAPPREELQAGLEKLKTHFEKLKAENWSTDKREFHGDVALLPIAVKAENARKPELNLHNFDTFQSFTDALKSGKLQNGRALIPFPVPEEHFAAADIRTIDDRISILVLEPLSVKKEIARQGFSLYLPSAAQAASELPANAKLTVLSIDAQKSNGGCKIFALSAASKMAKESEFFDGIHKDNLSGRLAALEMQDGSKQPAKIQVIDAHRLVPASFQKHTQAKSSLEEWADEDGLTQTMVNKQGDTLLSRFDKHAVERYKREVKKEGDSEENKLRRMRFNASIEDKRLIYLDRAIAYLDNAPQHEISGLLSGFKSAMKMHEKKNKHMASIEREIGPER